MATATTAARHHHVSFPAETGGSFSGRGAALLRLAITSRDSLVQQRHVRFRDAGFVLESVADRVAYYSTGLHVASSYCQATVEYSIRSNRHYSTGHCFEGGGVGRPWFTFDEHRDRACSTPRRTEELYHPWHSSLAGPDTHRGVNPPLKEEGGIRRSTRNRIFLIWLPRSCTPVSRRLSWRNPQSGARTSAAGVEPRRTT